MTESRAPLADAIAARKARELTPDQIRELLKGIKPDRTIRRSHNHSVSHKSYR